MNQPNRIEIKERAKKLIKGNIWNLLKPWLIAYVIELVVAIINTFFFTKSVACPLDMSFATRCTEATAMSTLVQIALSLASIVFIFGFIRYVLKFARGEQYSVKEDLFYYFKNDLGAVLLTGILTSIFITAWSLLLVIPGIIAAISYSMVFYLKVDTDKTGMDLIDESKKMMQGHKADYFVFVLSFLGWAILGGLTFGLAYIYVIPYISVSQALYYEEIKKINSNN